MDPDRRPTYPSRACPIDLQIPQPRPGSQPASPRSFGGSRRRSRCRLVGRGKPAIRMSRRRLGGFRRPTGGPPAWRRGLRLAPIPGAACLDARGAIRNHGIRAGPEAGRRRAEFMARSDSTGGRLPRGVTACPGAGGGVPGADQAREGDRGPPRLYETPGWPASPTTWPPGRSAAPPATGRDPRAEQPTPTRSTRSPPASAAGSGWTRPAAPPRDPPTAETLRTSSKLPSSASARPSHRRPGGLPDAALDASAGRLVEAAALLSGATPPATRTRGALTELLAHRLDRAFRRADLVREMLDDDGDDPLRVARWLVHPDASPTRAPRLPRRGPGTLYTDPRRPRPGRRAPPPGPPSSASIPPSPPSRSAPPTAPNPAPPTPTPAAATPTSSASGGPTSGPARHCEDLGDGGDDG